MSFQESVPHELDLPEEQTQVAPFIQEFNVDGYVNVEQQEKSSQLRAFVGMIPEFAQRVLDQYRLPAAPQVFISLPGGHAIVDPGAGQDLIGQQAYE